MMIMITLMMIQVRKAYDMEEDDETGRENFRIKATFLSICRYVYVMNQKIVVRMIMVNNHYALIQL